MDLLPPVCYFVAVIGSDSQRSVDDDSLVAIHDGRRFAALSVLYKHFGAESCSDLAGDRNFDFESWSDLAGDKNFDCFYQIECCCSDVDLVFDASLKCFEQQTPGRLGGIQVFSSYLVVW